MSNDQNQMSDPRRNRFDRAIGALVGIPDVVHSSPTTVRDVTPMVGDAATFIVQTYRHKEQGETLFIECVDDVGAIRLVIPPKVTAIINRQHDAISKRVRRSAARASAQDRKARGILPGFMKNRGKGGRRKKKSRRKSSTPVSSTTS